MYTHTEKQREGGRESERGRERESTKESERESDEIDRQCMVATTSGNEMVQLTFKSRNSPNPSGAVWPSSTNTSKVAGAWLIPQHPKP